MAIGFRAVTQIAAGGATDPMSAPAVPTGTATGDMVVLFAIVKYASRTITDPTSWTVVSNNQANNTGLTDSGNDAGNIRAAVWFREKDAGWSTMPALDLSGVPDSTMVGVISYTKAAGEAWVTPVCANAVDNSGATTGLDPAASGTTISFAAGDWFGSFAAVNGDAGTLGTHTCTVSGVTFGASNTRLNAVTTAGTDLRGHSIDFTYTSGTAVAGPDGALPLTTGAATGAGVMVFYRLRVVTKVTAVLAAPLNSLTGTATATYRKTAVLAAPMNSLSGTVTAKVKHPVVMAATLGGLTGTAAAVPEHIVVLAAVLGGLSATGTATPEHPAVLTAGLGGLAAAITATPEHPATLAANLGALSATAAASVTGGSNTVPAALSAPLGSLTGTATAVPEHPVTAAAGCGDLTAISTAVVRHSAVLHAHPGQSDLRGVNEPGVTAHADATVTSVSTVPAVLASDLGVLVAMANAGPPPPPPASVGFERFGGGSPAWGEVVSWVDYLNEGNYR